MAEENKNKDYKADSIKALEGLEAVRKRPGMYIGDTGVRGMHHLVYEVVDNSIDEAMAGYASQVSVSINEDGSVSVIDDGRGIPVDWHEQKQMSALTVVMTVLHAGGKFEGEAYKVSGGLHGVGVSVVNALSEWLEVEVFKGGKIHFQRFERGIPIGDVEERGKTKRKGTKVSFKPDPEIFKDVDSLDFNYETLANRMRELAFLNKGITININDESSEEEKKDVYCYKGGIKAFVEHLNQNKNIINNEVIYMEGRDEDSNIEVETALQYNDSYSENTLSFANNINTHEGGTHLSGFKSALTRCINNWGKKNNVIKEDAGLQGDDCREGLSAVISIRIPEPQFEGQTKTKLGNREVQGIVETAVNEGLGTYFEEHPGIARNIINRAVQAASARLAARKARDLARKKNSISTGDMPGKLADCISRDRESIELYLVEGDSAGGSAKVGRDNRTQAILPLKGKILNVEKNRLDKVLENKEIISIVSALSTGIGRDEFDIEKLRYGKIIIMTDADVDGSHIRTLILTFFYRYMPELVKTGRIFIAQPPLYRVGKKKKSKYILTEDDMNKALLKLGTDGTNLEYRNNGSSEKIEGSSLDNLLVELTKIGKLRRAIEKRNLTFERYIELKKELGVFPKYRGIHNEEEIFFINDEKLKNYIKEQEKKGKTIEVEDEEIGFSLINSNAEKEDDDDEEAENTEIIKLTEFVFCKELDKAAKVIESSGLDINQYEPPADPAEEGKFFLISGGDEIRVRCLGEVLEGTKSMGKKGMDIQRYKGLGEMNPEQLWETTMDPEKRTLLQVCIGDTVEADNLFSILMGEVVEPRRNFIQQHASDVENIDV
jgi:DNA gyrase subunit B